jgi:hypothetical protein
MICDGRPHANGKVLIKRVGEDLLPTAQAGVLAAELSGVGSMHRKRSY